MTVEFPRYPSPDEIIVNHIDGELSDLSNYIDKYVSDIGATVELRSYCKSKKWGFIARISLLNVDRDSNTEQRHTLTVWKQDGEAGFGAMDDFI